MSQDYRRLPLGGCGVDVGPTAHSVSTSLSHPFTRNPTGSAREGPDNNGRDGEDEVPASRLTGDCGYSRPFLFLDMIWNLAFVVVSIFVLFVTVRERPATPLRLWVFGYALQCLLHVGFLWDEYQRRGLDDDDDDNGGGRHGRNFRFRGVSTFFDLSHKSMMKKLESVNTVISSVWWVFGFYWIVIGGQPLLQDSPRLCWLSVVFLAFDLFFMIICIATACIIFLLLFCFFPILATVSYAMTVRDGASETDIRSLPKYIYRQKNILKDGEKQVNLPAPPSNSSLPSNLFLNPEDSECCICLYKYIDGAELCALPCNHHFHHKCITKWLRINATCPLCKFNILRGDMLV